MPIARLPTYVNIHDWKHYLTATSLADVNYLIENYAEHKNTVVCISAYLPSLVLEITTMF